jgi:hypothetical protein
MRSHRNRSRSRSRLNKSKNRRSHNRRMQRLSEANLRLSEANLQLRGGDVYDTIIDHLLKNQYLLNNIENDLRRDNPQVLPRLLKEYTNLRDFFNASQENMRKVAMIVGDRMQRYCPINPEQTQRQMMRNNLSLYTSRPGSTYGNTAIDSGWRSSDATQRGGYN